MKRIVAVHWVMVSSILPCDLLGLTLTRLPAGLQSPERSKDTLSEGPHTSCRE